MKKQITLLMVALGITPVINAEYAFIFVNNSNQGVEVWTSVHEKKLNNIQQQYARTDRYGLFITEEKVEQVRHMCISSNQEAKYGIVQWKYPFNIKSVFEGAKTPKHKIEINPLVGTNVIYLFRDGLIAVHNVTKDTWLYKRVIIDVVTKTVDDVANTVVKILPFLKKAVESVKKTITEEVLKEKSYSRSEFIAEVKRVNKRHNQSTPSDIFKLPNHVKNEIAANKCLTLGK